MQKLTIETILIDSHMPVGLHSILIRDDASVDPLKAPCDDVSVALLDDQRTRVSLVSNVDLKRISCGISDVYTAGSNPPSNIGCSRVRTTVDVAEGSHGVSGDERVVFKQSSSNVAESSS